MLYKNQIFGFVLCSIVYSLLFICTNATKNNKQSMKYKQTEDVLSEKMLYLHQPLQRAPVNPVVAGFNIKKPQFSALYNGLLGIKNFPMLHPYNAWVSAEPSVFMAAEVDKEYLFLPEYIKNAVSEDSLSVKIMILPLMYDEPVLYRPHHMVHSGSDSSNLLVTIRSGDFCQVSFDKQKEENFTAFTFSTHSGQLDDKTKTLVASPDNAKIVFLQKGKILQPNQIINGSFWIIHKEQQKTTATFFWILNQTSLQEELKVLLSQPDKTWLELINDISDIKKWGNPAKRLSEMFNLNQINEQRDDHTDQCDANKQDNASEIELILYEQPKNKSSADSVLGEHKAKKNNVKNNNSAELLFQKKMQQEGFIHIPTEQDGRCLYHAMTDVVNYKMLSAFQDTKHAPPLYSSRNIIQHMTDSLQYLLLEVEKNNLQLIEELNNLLAIESVNDDIAQVIRHMINCCEQFLTLPEQLPEEYWGNTQMFGLLGLLYNIEIRRYAWSRVLEKPQYLYDTPKAKYPETTHVLRSRILPEPDDPDISKEKCSPYIIACYPLDESINHCDTWLTQQQLNQIKEALQFLYTDVTTNDVQSWVMQGHGNLF